MRHSGPKYPVQKTLSTLMLSPQDIQAFLDAKAAEEERLGEKVSVYVVHWFRNVTLVLAGQGTLSGNDALVHGEKVQKLVPGSIRYEGLMHAIHYGLDLRTQNKFAKSRTAYYIDKKDQNTPWTTQYFCDRSFADAAAIFGRPRFALGITHMSNSRISGAIRWRCSGRTNSESAEFDQRLVEQYWLTDGALACWTEDDVSCVVVVESESMFDQLVQDEFAALHGVILATGLGQPDMALRAFLHRITSTLGLPVYGFFDWNSWGVAIAATYRFGSAKLPEAERYTFPLKYVGLKAQDVDAWRVPTQPLTDGDRNKIADLLDCDWIARDPSWSAELREMHRRGAKCEFEHLCEGVPPGDGSPVGASTGVGALQNLGLFVAQKLRAAGAIV